MISVCGYCGESKEHKAACRQRDLLLLSQVEVSKTSLFAPEGGTKHDDGKSRMDLYPRQALLEIGDVLAFGAAKYEQHNWRKGIQYSRLVAAALRHLTAWNEGEDKDPESGLSHLAHAGCCIAFLIEMQASRPDLDDRYKGNK